MISWKVVFIIVSFNYGVISIIDGYPQLMDEMMKYHNDELILGRIPNIYKTNKEIYGSINQNLNQIIKLARQYALKRIVSIITNNSVTINETIEVVFPEKFKLKYFWFLYVAVVHYPEIIINVLSLKYYESNNTLCVCDPFGHKGIYGIQRIYGYNYININIVRSSDVLLEIYLSLYNPIKLNYIAFIDDPWDSIIINYGFYESISNTGHNYLNEIELLDQLSKWKLSPKKDFQFCGLTCTQQPCIFNFISKVTHIFEINIRIVSMDAAYINIKDIIFGDEMKSIIINQISHISQRYQENSIMTPDYMPQMQIIIPQTATKFSEYIRLPANTLLIKKENKTDFNVTISYFVNHFARISTDLKLLDWKTTGFSNINIKGHGNSVLNIDLNVITQNIHKASQMDIDNQYIKTVINTTLFECYKRKSVSVVIPIVCRKDNLIIFIDIYWASSIENSPKYQKWYYKWFRCVYNKGKLISYRIILRNRNAVQFI